MNITGINKIFPCVNYPGTNWAMPDLASAYIPFQYLCTLYAPKEGLKQGTIFPELDKPYGSEPEYTVDA